MTAEGILNQIIVFNNSNVLNEKIELKKEIADNSVRMEFGVFPSNTFIVKESDTTQSKEILEKRGYERVVDFIIKKSISL